jgi:SAM-dependent methyltransferase
VAHREQQQFCTAVAGEWPQFFTGCRVLDVGSLDVNGNNRGLFTDCDYTGLDIAPGPNVDLVCKCHELIVPDASYDTVISTCAFEHDLYLDRTIETIFRVLRPGGLFVAVCAFSWPEHGTLSHSPNDSPLTTQLPVWSRHYRNVTGWTFYNLIGREDNFRPYYLAENGMDLQFWGVRS